MWKGLRDLFADSSLYLVNFRTDVLCFDMDTCTAQCDLVLLFLSWRNEILCVPLVGFTWKCVYTLHKETSMSIPSSARRCLSDLDSVWWAVWPELLISLWSLRSHMCACMYLCVYSCFFLLYTEDGVHCMLLVPCASVSCYILIDPCHAVIENFLFPFLKSPHMNVP